MVQQRQKSNHARPNTFHENSFAQLFATNTILFTKDDEVSWVDMYTSRCCYPVELEKSAEGKILRSDKEVLSMADCKMPMRIIDLEDLLQMAECKASLPVIKVDKVGANSWKIVRMSRIVRTFYFHILGIALTGLYK